MSSLGSKTMKGVWILLVVLPIVYSEYYLLPNSCPLKYDWGHCGLKKTINVSIACTNPGYSAWCMPTYGGGSVLRYNMPQWKNFIHCECRGFNGCPQCHITSDSLDEMCPEGMEIDDHSRMLKSNCKWVYILPNSKGMQYPLDDGSSNGADATCHLDIYKPLCQLESNMGTFIHPFWN